MSGFHVDVVGLDGLHNDIAPDGGDGPEPRNRRAVNAWTPWKIGTGEALRDWLLDRCEVRELWYHQVDGLESPTAGSQQGVGQA